MRVLIVDDSRPMRRVYWDVLSQLVEVELIEAEDGLQAVYQLEAHGFDVDLILLDWVMPRMDGLSLLRHLKSTENLREIPVIMITSCSDEAHVRRAWDAGADGYLLKPFTEELFLEAVLALDPDWRARERSAREVPAATEPRKIRSFLHDLSNEIRSRILNMSCLEEYPEAQIVLDEGDVVRDFLFVASGRIEEHQRHEGCGQLIRTYGVGECLGVTELVSGDPMRSRCSTLQPTTIGRLSRVIFEEMLLKFPEVGRALSRFLAEKAREVNVVGRSSEGDREGSERFEAIDLASLVQAIHLRQRTCRIEIPELQGRISFRLGQAWEVRDGVGDGEEAFLRLLRRNPTRFELVDGVDTGEPNVRTPTTRLLSRHARDER